MNTSGIVLFAMLGMVIIAFQFFQMKRTAELNDKLKKIVNDSNNQYQDVVEINKSLKHIRHDINKQKTIVRDMENGAPVETITGVEVIDRIIHFKSKEMEEKNIRFSVKTDYLESVSVGNGVLISIMTNVFDNAIEACSGIESPWINCDIEKSMGCNFRMLVENSKDKNVVVDTNGGNTTKSDKELHGYGLTIIRELVNRNSGAVSVLDKCESFVVDIKI